MTTFRKSILAGVIAAGLAVVIYGAYQYPKAEVLAGSSPAGTTFNTAKFAAVAVNLASAGANGTSTSILNTDANDRFVSSFKLGCEGVGTSKMAYTGAGLAALLLSVGTTTAANPASFSSFAAVATGVTVGTSTTNFLMSSSTLLTGSLNAAIWPTNTYMTFYFNATNTAACTVGVEYFGS